MNQDGNYIFDSSLTTGYPRHTIVNFVIENNLKFCNFRRIQQHLSPASTTVQSSTPVSESETDCLTDSNVPGMVPNSILPCWFFTVGWNLKTSNADPCVSEAYFSSPRMCLNLRALIFHRNTKKEGRRSAYRQTSFWVAWKAKGVARTLEEYVQSWC